MTGQSQGDPPAPPRGWSRRRLWRALLDARRDPGRIGDVALFKAELFGGLRLRPGLAERLRTLGATRPPSLARLAALGPGTVGAEYAAFMRANALRPFEFSAAVPAWLVARQVFVARYATYHDLFHVLTGFDTSWAGELGVWGFVAAQGYARGHWGAVVMACLLYPVLAPHRIGAQWRALWRGVRMGRAAGCVIAEDLEALWALPLPEARRMLGIAIGEV